VAHDLSCRDEIYLGLKRALCLAAVSTFCLAQSEAPAATIPLQPYLRAQAVVHAVVKGQPGTFLFDTGVGVSNFTPAFVKKIDCRP
jgi:hypothetical protein